MSSPLSLGVAEESNVSDVGLSNAGQIVPHTDTSPPSPGTDDVSDASHNASDAHRSDQDTSMCEASVANVSLSASAAAADSTPERSEGTASPDLQSLETCNSGVDRLSHVPATAPEARESSAENASPAGFTSDQDEPGLYLRILVFPFVVLMVLLHYSGIIDFGSEHLDRQVAAERVEAQSVVHSGHEVQRNERHSITQLPPSSKHAALIYKFIIKTVMFLDLVCRLLLRGILMLMWRLFLGGQSLFSYSFNWLKYQATDGSPGTIWFAFGILNFASAMLYYLVIFDGEGTYCPTWTSALG